LKIKEKYLIMTKTKINKFKKIKNSDFKFDRHGKEYNNQNQT